MTLKILVSALAISIALSSPAFAKDDGAKEVNKVKTKTLNSDPLEYVLQPEAPKGYNPPVLDIYVEPAPAPESNGAGGLDRITENVVAPSGTTCVTFSGAMDANCDGVADAVPSDPLEYTLGVETPKATLANGAQPVVYNPPPVAATQGTSVASTPALAAGPGPLAIGLGAIVAVGAVAVFSGGGDDDDQSRPSSP